MIKTTNNIQAACAAITQKHIKYKVHLNGSLLSYTSLKHAMKDMHTRYITAIFNVQNIL